MFKPRDRAVSDVASPEAERDALLFALQQADTERTLLVQQLERARRAVASLRARIEEHERTLLAFAQPPNAPEAEHAAAPARRATAVSVIVPETMRPDEVVLLEARITNHESEPLGVALPYPVALGARWFAEGAESSLADSDSRTPLLDALGGGDEVALTLRVVAPGEPGRYELRIAPVQEHVAWFDDLDRANGACALVVVAAAGTEGSATES